MARFKIKKKPQKADNEYKSNLGLSIFLLFIYLTQIIILLINHSKIPDTASFNSILFFEILVLAAIIFQFYYTYGLFKSYRYRLDLVKDRIDLRTQVMLDISDLDKKIEELEEKLMNLNKLYAFSEKDEFPQISNNFLKKPNQINDFRLKKDKLLNTLKKIRIKYIKIKKYELKLLKLRKLRNLLKLKRRIKSTLEDITKLNMEYGKFISKLKDDIKKKNDFIAH